jgi:hypothetical protein
MKNAKWMSAVVAGVACMGTASGMFLQGCGGDTSPGGAPKDSGTTDVTVDMNVPPMEAGPGDSGSADAGADAAPDAAMVAIGDYPLAAATALCQVYSNCCPFDGGVHFDNAKCTKTILSTYGFNYTLPGDLGIFDAGNVQFDAATAAQCVGAISALPNAQCIATGSAWANATKTCFAVTQGKIAIGHGPCASPFECVPGANCATTTDGGSQCVALSGAGGACLPNVYADTDCSYLGSGNTGTWCEPGDASPNNGTCQPTIADMQTCPSNGDYFGCASLGCGDDGNCGTGQALTTPFLCGEYSTDAGPPVDGGGDGGKDAGDGG